MRTFLTAILFLSIFQIKAQTSGLKVIWEDILGGQESDGFTKVIELENKDIFVGGYFRTENRQDKGEYWLARYNAEGKSLWQEIYPGRHGEQVFDVLATKDGGFVVLGGAEGANGLYNSLFKVDGKGLMQWSRTINQAEPYVLYGMEELPDGGFMLVGEMKHRNQLMTWVYKTDAEGNYLEDETYKKRNTPNNTQDFYLDEEGNLFLVGTAQLKEGPALQAMHIRPNGRLGWVEYFPKAYAGIKIIGLEDGSLLLGGYGYDEKDSTGTLDHNVQLYRLSKQGNLMWKKSISQKDSEEEELFDMAATPDGAVSLALKGQQEPDKPLCAWFLKMDYAGNILWEQFVKPKTLLSVGDLQITDAGDWLMVGKIPKSQFNIKNLDAYLGRWRYIKMD